MKKVQYLAAAAPAALGLMVQGATTVHAVKPAGTSQTRAKAVSLRHSKITPDNCTGSNFHSKIHSGLEIAFYSTPHGTRTCIGTIYVIGKPGARSVGASVANGHCARTVQASHETYGCHQSFTRPFSVGAASASAHGRFNNVHYRV